MMKSTRRNKKKEKSIQTKINWIVSITLMIFLPIAYVHKRQMLKESGITICKVIDKRRKPGAGVVKGKQATLEYYVDNHRYETIEWNSRDNYVVGDCFKIEYSFKKDQIADVLWDEGKQPCMSE